MSDNSWYALAAGDDERKGAVLPFRIVLELRSDQDAAFRKKRFIKGVRLDNEVPVGEWHPISPIEPNHVIAKWFHWVT